MSEEVVTHYLKPEGSNKKFIWTCSNCLCFHLFTQDPFPIIYWLCVKSFTASLISFDPFSCNKSLFRSVDVLKSLKLRTQWVKYTLFWFARFLWLLPGVQGESKWSVCWGFQWCEALSNLCLSTFYCTYISLWRGRMRPLHCNCLMCFSAVRHQSLARYLTELLRCFLGGFSIMHCFCLILKKIQQVY